MSVNFTKQYTNYGQLTPSTPINWLHGNVCEWQEVKLNVKQGVYLKGDIQNTISIISQNEIRLNNGKSWRQLGFRVGQSISMSYVAEVSGAGSGDTAINKTFNITEINNDVLITDNTFTDYQDLPSIMPGTGQLGQFTIEINRLVIYSTERAESVELSLGHVANSASQGGTLNSFIDNTTSVLKAENIDNLSAGVGMSMEQIGYLSGMAIHSATVKYVSSSSFIHNYEIVIKYMMHGVFDDLSNYDDLLNITNPEVFYDTDCLTDNFKLRFYQRLNNPNVYTENKIDTTPLLGGNGGFNESFNTGKTSMSINSITYTNQQNEIVSTVDYSSKTTVTAFITGCPNVTNLSTKCTFGFLYLPLDDEDFKENERPFHQNIFLNSGGFDVTTVSTVGSTLTSPMFGFGYDNKRMDIENSSLTRISSSTIKVVFTLNPTSQLTDFFNNKPEENRKFLLWFNTSDHSKEANDNDRATIILSTGLLAKAPVVGLPLNQTVEIFEHDKDPLTDTGLNTLRAYVEDDLVFKNTFDLDVFVDTSEADYKSFTYGFQVRNTSINEVFNLEKELIDISGSFHEANGSYIIDVDQERDFIYINGSQKNKISIQRKSSNDTLESYGYVGYFATKIRWEDWISKTGVPIDFRSINELNNGSNNDWYHYFSVGGWAFEFFTELIYSDLDGTEISRKNTYPLQIDEYDSNTDIATLHKYFRHSDNVQLNNSVDPDTGKPMSAILQNELTRVEIYFESLTSDVWSTNFQNDSFGTINLEIFRGSGRIEHRTISTIHLSEPDNPLRPLDGETLLNWEIIANKTLKLTCLIDPDLLPDAEKFHITGRVESPPRQLNGKLMEDGTLKHLENGIVKIID